MVHLSDLCAMHHLNVLIQRVLLREIAVTIGALEEFGVLRV